LIRLSLRVLLAATCLALAAAPAASAQAPTLTGELFHVGGVEPVTDPAIHVSSYQCDPLPGGAGHLTMTAEGLATGPYPGTFTETLTVSWGDRFEGVDQGPVESVEATFRIEALDGSVVTGTKRFNENSPVPGPAPQWAACAEMPDEESYNAFFEAALRYDATIHTADGTFQDEGDAVAYGSFFRSSELTWWQSEFRETFISNPAPDAPATREDCEKDGWQTYGTFKNRGDCVAYVVTGGRNPAAGLG
jgi:hypothetical protein